LPRYLVALERTDRTPLIVNLVTTADSEREAIALATAAAERRRGGRFELVHVAVAPPAATVEVLTVS
jgi:hypothetical protein